MEEKEDACIICLSGLPTTPENSTNAAPTRDDEGDELPFKRRRLKSPARETELLANLQPCKHHLHNDCLKDWAERSNRCPLCRERFNLVEVSAYLNGKLLVRIKL
jgi:Ring finger domain